jgi:predicted neuraminidase
MEGTMAQHLEYSINRDGTGESWSDPTRLRLKLKPSVNGTGGWEERGGQWGPVLHNDGLGKLWLFYSESREGCIRPPVEDYYPKRYIIGGDIKVIKLDLRFGTWSMPELVYSQNVDSSVPKVTANKLIVLSTGEWLLPFWREKPGQICKSNVKGTKTSAGVLISTNKGRTWAGYAILQHSHSWLIENTLVEAKNGDLIMFFRTNLGFIVQSRSLDNS